MKFIDLHCDTLLRIADSKGAMVLAKNDGHIDVEKLRQGDALAQFFAIFIPKPKAEETFGEDGSYKFFNWVYETYQKEMEANKQFLAPACNFEDIMKNKADGKISAVLTIEEGDPVQGKIERIQEFYDKGVRLITLTWNYENSIGYPNSDDAEAMKKGLKPFGIEVVKRMNELGMLVDVSHLSEGGFYDVAKHSSKPFVASHSCARNLCSHRRNLWDDQLKVMGETGSIVGVNFASAFMNDGGEVTTIDDVVRHMIHIKNKAGIEAVAFGSDFDGISPTLEFKDYLGMNKIADALTKHFTPAEIDLICNGNALRVIKAVLK